MAITAGDNLNSIPSPTQNALNSNYIDFTNDCVYGGSCVRIPPEYPAIPYGASLNIANFFRSILYNDEHI